MFTVPVADKQRPSRQTLRSTMRSCDLPGTVVVEAELQPSSKCLLGGGNCLLTWGRPTGSTVKHNFAQTLDQVKFAVTKIITQLQQRLCMPCRKEQHAGAVCSANNAHGPLQLVVMPAVLSQCPCRNLKLCQPKQTIALKPVMRFKCWPALQVFKVRLD